MSDPTRDEQRLSFGAVADAYDDIRPSYPVEALRWVLGDAPLRVVDLGAGTGLLTRVLVELGHEVTAVEPDPGMLARLSVRSPSVVAVEGSAEATGLPAASVDAVVAGQAYHWFDPGPAHAEIARVLRSGGIFGPVWNFRDESVGWVARLSDLVGRKDGGAYKGELGGDAFGAAFGALERAEFASAVTHTADSLVALMRSRSYYITATPERQREIETGIRELVATHQDLRGRETFDLPYVTRAYRAARR